ncbi:MAG: DUF3313 domain-containing protein [Planctomycetota bacterium]
MGFLSDYSRLESVSDTTLTYTNPKVDLADYSKFILDPVVVHFHDEAEKPEMSRKELAELRQHMFAAVHNAILKDYQIVRRSGPGVARIRIAITDIKKSTPVLTVLPPGRLVGFGLGGAAMEAEVLDSQTGEQIGAVIESQEGNRLSLEGLSKWGDTKAVMNAWAEHFKELIDEAHRY